MRANVLPGILLLSIVLVLGGVCPAAAQFYLQLNLVSDGAVPAGLIDARVVNAWGFVSGPTTPWWISDNGTGLTTLYNVETGAITNTFTMPGAGGPDTLFFTAGPFEESHGLFGSLVAVPPPGRQ